MSDTESAGKKAQEKLGRERVMKKLKELDLPNLPTANLPTILAAAAVVGAGVVAAYEIRKHRRAGAEDADTSEDNVVLGLGDHRDHGEIATVVERSGENAIAGALPQDEAAAEALLKDDNYKRLHTMRGTRAFFPRRGSPEEVSAYGTFVAWTASKLPGWLQPLPEESTMTDEARETAEEQRRAERE